jgi:hypothetical protein
LEVVVYDLDAEEVAMTATTTLLSGLSDVHGSCFEPLHNRLLFIEGGSANLATRPFIGRGGGKLSYLELIPDFTIVSSGGGEIDGTWGFDFDTGVMCGDTAAADIFWAQDTAVFRRLIPRNGATIVNLGSVPFATISPEVLAGLAFATTAITGNDDATNELITGDVFAVHTSAGHFAKVQVTAYGYFMQIQWVTYRKSLRPNVSTSIISSSSGEIEGTCYFDFDTGSKCGAAEADVWWAQDTSVVRRMVPCNNAGIVNLGAVPFSSVLPETLAGLAYSTMPLNGNDDATNELVTGDVFAVRTNAGHFAKVLVTAYGYYMKVQWVTYHILSGYGALGTGYDEPHDVKLCTDGTHAYITEGQDGSGGLLKIGLRAKYRPQASVVCSGLKSPQQMVLDEAHNAAYVVECAPSGRLLKIDTRNGSQTELRSGLSYAMGLLLSSDKRTAYISERTPNARAGRIIACDLRNGQSQALPTNLHKPGYLAWADPAETAIYTTEGDAAGSVVEVKIASGTKTTKVTGLPARPSSVAALDSDSMLVCCTHAIDKVDV